MRLHYARTEGLIGIPRSEIDFDALPPAARTVAVVADNGTGKSTLLGAMYAAIHLEMPDRPGNLVDQFNGQGELELIWSYGGHRYRSLLKVEGRQKEAFLFVDGEAKSRTGGGVSKYLAEIRERFLTAEESKATWFGAQTKTGAFTGLDKHQKRQFVVRSLALSVPVAIANRARDLAREADRQAEALTVRIADLRRQQEALPGLRASLEPQDSLVRSAISERDRIHARITALQREEAEIAAKGQAQAEIEAKVRECEAAIASRRTRASELQRAIASQLSLLSKADDIRRAAAEVADLEAGLATERAAQSACEEQLEGLRAAQQDVAALALEIKTAEQERDAAARSAQDARAQELAALTAQIADLQRETTRIKGEARTVTVQTENIESRIAERSQGAAVLKQVLFGEDCAPCLLAKGAVEARDSLPELEMKLAEARSTGGQLQDRLGAIAVEIADVEEQIAAVKAQPLDVGEVEACAARIGELSVRLESLAPAEGQARETRARVDGHRSKAATLENQLKAARSRAQEIHALEAAETRSRELASDLGLVKRDLEALEVDVEGFRKDLSAARQHAEALARLERQRAALEADRGIKERQVQIAQERLGEIKGQIRALESLSTEIDQAEGDRAAASDRFAVFNHLARAFGEEGIQALKIDAAGPEVSGLTNELLSTCYGPRFAVKFETQRALLSRDGMAEEFDIRILDTERGSALFDAKSGGERVILGEALALGLSLFKSLRSGRRVETLIRDEADGALSPDRAQRYLEMLARAAEIGEFHRLIFVSHRQEIWEQADARLFLRPDGTFTVG